MSAPINNLPEWLNAATESLSASAKERIKLEIESHFEQAVESHYAEGLTEAQAQTRALSELGDAKAAAKVFQKNYLTETEAKLVEAELRRNRSIWFVCLVCGGYVLVFDLFYRESKPHIPLILPGALLIMVLTFQIICLWLARCPISRSSIRLLFTFQMLAWLSMIVCNGFFAQWRLSVVLMIVAMSRPIRLWFKIQRAADLGQETPPPSATVS